MTSHGNHHIKTHPRAVLRRRNRLRLRETEDNTGEDDEVDMSENANAIEAELNDNPDPQTELLITPNEDEWDYTTKEEFKNVRFNILPDANEQTVDVNFQNKDGADVNGGWALTEPTIEFTTNEQLKSAKYYEDNETDPEKPLFTSNNQINVNTTLNIQNGADHDFAENSATLAKQTFFKGYKEWDTNHEYPLDPYNWIVTNNVFFQEDAHAEHEFPFHCMDYGRIGIYVTGDENKISQFHETYPAPGVGDGLPNILQEFMDAVNTSGIHEHDLKNGSTHHVLSLFPQDIYDNMVSPEFKETFVSPPIAGITEKRALKFSPIISALSYIIEWQQRKITDLTSRIETLETTVNSDHETRIQSNTDNQWEQMGPIFYAGLPDYTAIDFRTFPPPYDAITPYALSQISQWQHFWIGIEQQWPGVYNNMQKAFIVGSWMSSLSWFQVN